jgi:moderate conductance mechanosensitive channel
MLDTQPIITTILDWLVSHGITLAAIFIGVFAVRKFSGIFIDKSVRRFIRPDHFHSKEAEKKREDTLIGVLGSTVGVVIWIVGGMMILSEVGVDIGPLIAAAGIVGVALGFGGQYLIRDVISGLFIIIENQYRVGDVVCLDDTCGAVESINLRLTILRDLDGVVHNVPNGAITKASNLSKDFARVNLNIGVAYDSDIEHVEKVVNKVGKELAKDAKWKKHITKPPEFLRISEFGDSSIVIKILGDTEPMQQWAVTGELRKRLKIAFDKEGIEIPFPHRVIVQKREK